MHVGRSNSHRATFRELDLIWGLTGLAWSIGCAELEVSPCHSKVAILLG